MHSHRFFNTGCTRFRKNADDFDTRIYKKLTAHKFKAACGELKSCTGWIKVKDAQKAASLADMLFGGEGNKVVTYIRNSGKSLDDLLVFQIVYPYPTRLEAIAAFKVKQADMNSSSSTFSVTVPANYERVKAFAEGHVSASGWRDEITSVIWKIKRISKKFSPDNGFTILVSSKSV